MSMNFWYGSGDNDAVSAGSLLRIAPALAEIAKVLDGHTGFDELQSLPEFAEQEVTHYWLDQVGNQARRFLTEYGNKVSGQTRVTLENLINNIRKSKQTKVNAPRL